MAKSYRICSRGEVIGTSPLDYHDKRRKTAYGVFKPTPAYKKVQKVFLLYVEAQEDHGPPDTRLLSEYRFARDELQLSVETARGKELDTELIHIADYSLEMAPDDLEVEVRMSSSSFFKTGR